MEDQLLPQNQIDKRFLVELNAPIHRSIIDINTYFLDQNLGSVKSDGEYSVGLLFQNLSKAIKQVNRAYDIELNQYTLFGDYGTVIDVEEADENIYRVRTHSYILGDSEKIDKCFNLLEKASIARFHRRSEQTSDRNKKREIYPLVLSKFMKDPQNLITLDSEVKENIHTAINAYLKARDEFFQEEKSSYFLMCVLFASLSVENRMWLVYEKMTSGNPQTKTLGHMIEKSFKVDSRRKKKLFTQQFKSDLLELNNIRIKTVHPSTRQLNFPDDAITALVGLGELLVRCDEYGI